MCYYLPDENNRSRKNMLLFKNKNKNKETVENIYNNSKWRRKNCVWYKNPIARQSLFSILCSKYSHPFRKKLRRINLMKLPHEYQAQGHENTMIMWMCQTNRSKRSKYFVPLINNMQNNCYNLQYREKERKKKQMKLTWNKRKYHVFSNMIFFVLLHLLYMTNAQIENEMASLSFFQIPSTNSPSVRPTTATPTFTPSIATLEPTEMASISPSQYITKLPSTYPSTVPTSIPSSVPTTMPSDVFSSSPSYIPSNSPSFMPSLIPSSMPSLIPSSMPSSTPSLTPSLVFSNSPSTIPSMAPSLSPLPSTTPSVSKIPSLFPSLSPSISSKPSQFPSLSPSLSVGPSSLPTTTHIPTLFRSSSPSLSAGPSSRPSNQDIISITRTFSQKFERKDRAVFSMEQRNNFMQVYSDLTVEYASADFVETTCSVLRQYLDPISYDGRFLQTTFGLTVVYDMEYSTRYNFSISHYPDLFMDYMRNETNREVVKGYFRSEGITTEVVGEVEDGYRQEPSVAPSESPTNLPNPEPSAMPSLHASEAPTLFPSIVPSGLSSDVPSPFPSIKTDSPTIPPPIDYRSIFIGAASIVVGLLILFYAVIRIKKLRKSKCCGPCKKPDTYEEGAPQDGRYYPNEVVISDEHSIPGDIIRNSNQMQHDNSEDSNSSIISRGESSMSIVTVEEVDEDGILKRIFDSVKKDVSGSEASLQSHHPHITRDILFDKYDLTGGNIDDYTWNGCTDVYGIEATALCKISDWKKRQQGANESEKLAFMKQNIRTMMLSVEHKIISPQDASRIIHECLALLGLPLQGEIPKTCLIVTGMVKTATSEDLLDGFKEFGEIEGNAVAGGERGFGIVRYQSPKSVTRALEKYHTEEIIVQDVAVVIRLLAFEPDNRTEPIIPPWSTHDSPPVSGDRRATWGQRSNHDEDGPDHLRLDIIGYPHGSLGRHDN